MLGEIYVASALAIFLAIFGWSERMFGLSSKHVRMILSFCEKTKLTYQNYIDLMNLIKKEKKMNPGKYLKEIVKILSGSNIKQGDKTIMNKLKENSELLKELDNSNKHKKIYFIVLFIYLFIGGTSLIYSETYYPYLFLPIIIVQIILILIIGIGVKIYNNIIDKETKIHNNLMFITTKREVK